MGRLFREFAITLAVTILVSAVVSLTLTPMMCAKILKHKPESQQGWFYRKSEYAFNWVIAKYGTTLRWVLRHQPLTLAVTVATLDWHDLFVRHRSEGLLPGSGHGRNSGSVAGSAGRIFQRNVGSAAGACKSHSAGSSGGQRVVVHRRGWNQYDDEQRAHSDQFEAAGGPGHQRERHHSPVAAEGCASGWDHVVHAAGAGPDGGRSREPDAISIHARRYGRQGAEHVDRAAGAKSSRRYPSLRDVATDQQNGGLQTLLVIDRDTASRLGIGMQQIDDTLYDAFGQRLVSTMFTQLNQYHVVLEVAPEFRRNPTSLDDIYIHSANGMEVPLGSFTHFEQSTTSLTVNHQGQFPVVTISFNLPSGESLGHAVKDIKQAEQDIGLPLSVHSSFQGTAAAFQNSLANEAYLIIAAVVVVYIVLGVLYESYIHPITILSTLPSAGVGAILAIFICHEDFNVVSLIGIILLIGIVKKNAIMMIDFALEAERHEGKPAHEAIYQASLLRFRPIMMTTFAALFGGLPLALGTGVGSELRRPLGITIVGGLILSQVLTLYTTPVVYLFFDRLAKRLTGVRERKTVRGRQRLREPVAVE